MAVLDKVILPQPVQRRADDGPARESLASGVVPLEHINYLEFRTFRRRGVNATPLSLIFDSFLVQQVTRQKPEVFRVNYTIGAPVVDVYHSGPEIISVSMTMPDTAPFFRGLRLDDLGIGNAGYLGESFEAFRAIYDKYFRAHSATDRTDFQGYATFFSQGREDRGYLLDMRADRNLEQVDHIEMSFEMFVARSSFLSAARPEALL